MKLRYILPIISLPLFAAESPLCLKGKISNTSPEKDLKVITKKLSDDEVFIRLIYAETLASGCPSEGLTKAIAWVIRNRIEAKDQRSFALGRDVVFKEKQFRSSTGSCDVSRRKDFLCPMTGKIWDWASTSWERTKKETSPMRETYQYFFFKHFDESKDCKNFKNLSPSWAKEEKRVYIGDLPLIKDCVGFYR